MTDFYHTILSYLSIYRSTAVKAWDHMTPPQYASILILVAVVGFISMRSKK